MPGHDTSYPVAIVGGGPAGLIAAIELGRRGVKAILFEDDPAPPAFPKANATTSRSMEHYRRLGFADRVRAHALPADYPADVTYLTRYSGTELARLPGARFRAADWRQAHRDRWPTPEPLARVQQMYVETEMRAELARHPSVTVMLGWQVEAVDAGSHPHRVVARNVAGGEEIEIACSFLVGADGARSQVRRALGIRYDGLTDQDRAFFGGRMLATYFRSQAFYDATGTGRSWQYWAVNPQQRGLVCAIDASELFVHHTQLKDGEVPSESLARESLVRAMGKDFAFEIIGHAPWTAGFALVAERMAGPGDAPTVFLAGDAAHLFTPTGGQGYNTAVDDAVNLGWKLAAVCLGWGGPGLLASYEAERRPVAVRNTAFARAMAESIGRVAVPADIEDPGSEAARRTLGEALALHSSNEFDIPGISFGVFYGASPAVANDGSPPPPDEWNRYEPSTVPGARAPHIWTSESLSIHDLFGRDFTLVRFARPEAGEDEALARLGVPVSVVDLRDAEARDLYQRDYVLIRPDHHVAWRGDRLPEDFEGVLRQVAGWNTLP